MRNTAEIKMLAEQGLEEAKVLLENKLNEGALYLAGYCIELLMKARITIILEIPNLFNEDFSPREFRKPFYIHDLKYLLIFAGLKTRLDDVKASSGHVYKNWCLIEETWNEHCRYKNCGDCKTEDVKNFIFAIEDQTNGLKQWIEKQ